MIVYILNQTMVKIPFIVSCLARLTQHSLDVSLWLTHKSAPFCHHTLVHNVSVFDNRHLNHCQFYQRHTPTALIEDAILNLV